MRKIRLPRNRYEATCRITDIASMTNSPPTNTRRISCLISTATVPSVAPIAIDPRSEEHTSELQSQSNLVCRLLLEKKKKKTHLILRPTAFRLHLPVYHMYEHAQYMLHQK